MTTRVGDPSAVVAVGASAGGVQELSRFVGELPDEGTFALLVVLHLSPRGPSVLADILQRRTTWSPKSRPVAHACSRDTSTSRAV